MDGTIHTDYKPTQSAGLYVHVPFCLKKCAYCDFYSVSDLSLKPVFLEALKREMRLVRQLPLTFDTLYIGGGTPSVLEADDISQVIENAFRYFVLVLKDWDLINGDVIAIDSFKIRAQNSLKNNFNQKKIHRQIRYIDEKIAEYEKQLDEEDEEDERQELKNKIDHKKTRNKSIINLGRC